MAAIPNNTILAFKICDGFCRICTNNITKAAAAKSPWAYTTVREVLEEVTQFFRIVIPIMAARANSPMVR
jgi:hypothetical protein